MTNRNYGITFCKRVIANLEGLENEMIKKTGLGFDILGREIVTLRQYKTYLKRFQAERDAGRAPSYDPAIHGE